MLSVRIIAKSASVVVMAVLFMSCVSRSNLPISASFTPEPERTIVLVGTGEAFRFSDGKWIKSPGYNYEFSVIQRRYADRWESIKEMHRRHPDYSGLAGPRDQTHHFVIRFEKGEGGSIPFIADTTMGSGAGKADESFKEVVVELEPEGVSVFAPFNIYRITQRYSYKEGFLRETVEVIKRKDGREHPFMKMEEEALIFIRTTPPEQDN